MTKTKLSIYSFAKLLARTPYMVLSQELLLKRIGENKTFAAIADDYEVLYDAKMETKNNKKKTKNKP